MKLPRLTEVGGAGRRRREGVDRVDGVREGLGVTRRLAVPELLHDPKRREVRAGDERRFEVVGQRLQWLGKGLEVGDRLVEEAGRKTTQIQLDIRE